VRSRHRRRVNRVLVPIVGAVLANWVLFAFLTHPPRDVAVAEPRPRPDPIPIPPVPNPPDPVPPPDPPDPVPPPDLLDPVPPPDPVPVPGPGPSPPDFIVFDPSEVDEPPIPEFVECGPERIDRDFPGVVRVRFMVIEDGSVTDIEVTFAQPKGVFEEAAVECVSKWKYKPAQINGRPVRCRRLGEVIFESGR